MDVQALLDWFAQARRDLPWRHERSGYAVWVSEVMLQQTTASVVAERMPAFIARFPTLESLAAAAESEVLAAWAGLGYYRRARALHAGAQAVMSAHGGQLPQSLRQLLDLPGIGSYTAGAILSFAFDLRAAAVDGNVARVFSRLLAEEREIEAAPVRKRFEQQSLAWLPDHVSPRIYNEAWIELGALICRPEAPRCAECPVQAACAAHRAGRVGEFPRRKARPASKAITSHRALIERDGAYLLVERPAEEGRLAGFLEFPGVWTEPNVHPESALRGPLAELGLELLRVHPARAEIAHSITVHRIRARLHPVDVCGMVPPARAHWCARGTIDPQRITTETRKLLVREARA